MSIQAPGFSGPWPPHFQLPFPLLYILDFVNIQIAPISRINGLNANSDHRLSHPNLESRMSLVIIKTIILSAVF